MKCEKCGNDYPTQYYFTTPTICNECFSKLPPEEQQRLGSQVSQFLGIDSFSMRIGFGLRFGAALIDMAFVMIIVGIVLFASGIINEYAGLFAQMLTDQSLMKEFQSKIAPISLLITLLYYSLEIFVAATPGKLILGIQIAGSNQVTTSTQALALRYLLKHLDTILGGIGLLAAMNMINQIGSLLGFIILIGFFFTLAKKRQAFHDMLANTAVYKRADVLEEGSMQGMNQ